MQYSEQFLRQRKMMLVLPLVVAPMLALCFYGLGGGKGGGSRTAGPAVAGLNMRLPEARFKGKGKALDKEGFYRQAHEDSVRQAEMRKMDPYYARQMDSVRVLPSAGSLAGLGPGPSQADRQADELMERLTALKAVLHRQDSGRVAGWPAPSSSLSLTGPGRREVDVPPLGVPGRVSVGREGDPDLDRLNAMLDKIYVIQHPGAVADTSRPVGSGNPLGPLVGMLTGKRVGQVLNTMTAGDSAAGRYEPGPGGEQGSGDVDLSAGFMELGSVAGGDSLAAGTVAALVARDQTLVSGTTVELRLDQEADIDGVRVPRGSPVWGKATLSGERLLVTVTSIRVGQSFLPVSLEVYDLDGMAGIRARGSMDRDVAKESADEAVGSLGVTSLDPSVAGQATAAGIQAARSLISRKVRTVRVSVHAGTRVFLRNVKLLNH